MGTLESQQIKENLIDYLSRLICKWHTGPQSWFQYEVMGSKWRKNGRRDRVWDNRFNGVDRLARSDSHTCFSSSTLKVTLYSKHFYVSNKPFSILCKLGWAIKRVIQTIVLNDSLANPQGTRGLTVLHSWFSSVGTHTIMLAGPRLGIYFWLARIVQKKCRSIFLLTHEGQTSLKHRACFIPLLYKLYRCECDIVC